MDPTLKGRVVRHCHRLANRHGCYVKEYSHENFSIVLVTAKDDLHLSQTNGLKFSLGQVGENSPQWDRFLHVNIDPSGLTIENDYAGTIPVFYSQKHGALVVSNIEPCVFIGSDSSFDDISYENLYGFLRYSHFIWDETAWKSIYQMLPDCRYRFSHQGTLVQSDYLETVKATDSRAHLSDGQVAKELFELNRTLVERSLADAPEIVLPLSSGYDSRMIFSVLANDKEFAGRFRCFTYGSSGSIEVESGRRLSNLKRVSWHQVELPCAFLKQRYLRAISDIFGASLHMHGMYQIEFYEELKEKYLVPSSAHLTSGFMTGVPAGQHNGLLQITTAAGRLTDTMNRFAQSRFWSDQELENLPVFSGKHYLEGAEQRFRAAFDRFQGDLHQKAVMFDVWTRQRNFIGYYPRVFEWLCPVVSPHMCTDYANFFMSLGKEHLWDRRAVELMFLYHYPDIAKVGSNSNGLASLGSRLETSALFLSRALNVLGLRRLLPRRYQNVAIEFDLKAVKNCGAESFFPLFTESDDMTQFNNAFGGLGLMDQLYQRAIGGDSKAYAQIVTLQAVALNSVLMADI